MTLHDDAVRTLAGWHAMADEQRDLQAAFLAHLAAHADGLSRDCHPDHVTASGLVVSHDRAQVLLNLHGRYKIWMQFGGHCEAEDDSIASAALREMVEESGIDDLRLISTAPVQLSRHEVQCGPIRPSHHLDVRYVAVAPAGAEAVASDESFDVQWFDRDALPDGLEPEVVELIEQSRWL